MHPALEVPEIVELICQLAVDIRGWDRRPLRDLSVLARTSKMIFHNPALDVLWKHQKTILRILRCMPPDLWQITESKQYDGPIDIRLRREIVPADWDRASIYLRRVKSFTMDAVLGSAEFLDKLSLCLPASQQHLFPKLDTLHWAPRPASAFHHVHLFLVPGITNILLGPIGTISDLSILSHLAITCPALTNVTIITKDLGKPQIPVISKFVRSLHDLKSLDVPALDQTALTHVARLPHLKSLVLREPSKFIPASSDRSRSSPLPFPALGKLKFDSATLSCATVHLALLSGSPVQDFSISSNSHRPVEPDARQFYAALAHHLSHSSLQYIHIAGGSGSDDPFPRVASAERIARHAVRGDALQPLFAFTNLVKVTLTHPVGFDIDDTTLRDMARAWPNLANLALRSAPYRHMRSTHVTLEGLAALAAHSQQLFHLELVLDATVIPPLRDAEGKVRANQDRLRVIEVECSRIKAPRRVATFLHAIFPELREIKTLYQELGISEDDGEEAPPGVWESHDIWKEAESALCVVEDGAASYFAHRTDFVLS
ncbi:hypothetical protein FB451DRAFT_1387646 [Mycena latifolia]|nr:hypothetical protein FB451DRAFT_1387646 [Mycena latifolia]